MKANGKTKFINKNVQVEKLILPLPKHRERLINLRTGNNIDKRILCSHDCIKQFPIT